ncbi:MAG: lysylphosphatidylglycerol synthase transmembrane domain-containing protein [Thermonemataceae bacterium]|nr:lysylphosphatidylglycerol synthase transmembrane domain-containing protein [Thermonemataceae bacterium]
MFLKIFLSYILPLALGIALFYFMVVPNIDGDKMLEIFRNANPLWIVLSAVFALISHWARGYRACMLLKPLGYKVNPFRSFLAVMVGYLANLALPRAGEVIRCGTLQKMEGVPAQVSFGTVVTERIIDLMILLGLVILVLVLEFDRISHILFSFVGGIWQNLPKEKLYLWAGILAILFVGFLLMLYIFRKQISLFFRSRVGAFLKGIWQGILSVRQVSNKPAFVFYTLLIWLMYYLMAYVLFFASPATAGLSPIQGLAILVMGGIGMAMPVQGGVGAYNLLVGKTLESYKIAKDAQQNIILSNTIGTFMHIVQTLVIVVFGGIAFLLVWFMKKKETKE